ncbi:MAG: hypothetical protein JWM93_2933 [Frankiales bacterium]|nr:hypothetical protein [Frankiales bacterium]
MSATTDALERELRGLRSRLREATPTWFSVAAPPFASRAEGAFHVVRRIALAAFSAEFRDRDMPELPRLPVLSLPDQLDVVADDLLTAAPIDGDVAGRLLAELLLHRWHIDGSLPGPSSTALAHAATGEADLAGWQRLCDLGADAGRAGDISRRSGPRGAP